jgi:hypothetical protein
MVAPLAREPLVQRARWLLLIHQLPKDPAYLRVKVGRRLARVGAVALKNSVYVLPRSDAALEDFQWVRREILEGGGEATLVEAELVEGASDADLEEQFRKARNGEYAELARDVRQRIAAARRRKHPPRAEERAAIQHELVRLERRLGELATTDFFGASGQGVVSALLRELADQTHPAKALQKRGKDAARVAGATWVTRSGIHVDRIASGWLIRRFVDPDARFKFVPPAGYEPLAGELRFDMFEAEFSHEGDACTFETLLGHFGLSEPGLRVLGEIVHDIDLKESKFGRPEAAGVAASVLGICRSSRDDDERLARGSELFDGLLAHFSVTERRAHPGARKGGR